MNIIKKQNTSNNINVNPIDAGDILSFKDRSLGELRLIAGAENNNVRILGN